MPWKDKEKHNAYQKERKRKIRAANKAKGLRCDGVPMAEKKPLQTREEKNAKRRAWEKQRSPEAKAAERERKRLYKNKRLKEDQAFRVKANLRIRLAKMASRQENPQRGSHVKLLGCTTDFFLKYIEGLWTEGMSWENYGNTEESWSLDHIKPLSSFDLLDEEQLKECCHYTNLQPLWHMDNVRKGNLC